MQTLDHLLLTQGHPPEVKKLRTVLLGAQAGDVADLMILHEVDNRCCRQEAWEDTLASIVNAVTAREATQ